MSGLCMQRNSSRAVIDQTMIIRGRETSCAGRQFNIQSFSTIPSLFSMVWKKTGKNEAMPTAKIRAVMILLRNLGDCQAVPHSCFTAIRLDCDIFRFNSRKNTSILPSHKSLHGGISGQPQLGIQIGRIGIASLGPLPELTAIATLERNHVLLGLMDKDAEP